MELNYEEGYIKFTDEKPTQDYVELPCKFAYSGKFYVELEVNGIRDKFLFDTGNKMTVFLNSELYTNLGTKDYTIKNIGHTVAGAAQVDIDVYRAIFNIQDQLQFEFPVGIDRSSKRSVLSNAYIKKFNWIIDPKNEKVYCKPIDKDWLIAKKELKAKVDRIFCSEIDNKLLVSYINFETANYSINDQIIAVNDQIVTPENICDMQNLLNKSTDWSTLNLEVIPSRKK